MKLGALHRDENHLRNEWDYISVGNMKCRQQARLMQGSATTDGEKARRLTKEPYDVEES